MRCHYEVLALERDAAAKDVKKAFHVQALRWHPDKHQRNNISPEEATLRFQEIQSAYEVLSDAHERKWYDDHREQILRGDADNDSDGEGGTTDHDGLNLFKYFSPRVYTGFGTDEKSFYNVYGDLFRRIDDLDVASVATSTNTLASAPVLGNNETPITDVTTFYQHWTSYIAQRSFAWVDEYKTTDAPSRIVRRAMEKENKKLRDAAKKAFTTDVRELVDFVKRRDPRMLAFQKQREKDKADQQRALAKQKAAKQAAFAAERDAFQQAEHARWAATAEDTSRHTQRYIDDELAQLRAKLDADVLLCELCRKSFKSAKQLQNHVVSKKHRDMEIEMGIVGTGDSGSDYYSLEAELEKELQAEVAAAKALQAQQRNAGDGKTAALDSLSLHDDSGGKDDQDDEDEDGAALAQQEATAQAAEEARLLKDQKAADKRRERKEQRKQQKKDGVEKLVGGGSGGGKTDAKDKNKSKSSATLASGGRPTDTFSDSDDDSNARGSRRKNGKGKKRG